MNITSTDAATVVQLIDIMTQRGAIRGDELVAVGAVRQKFHEASQETNVAATPTTKESKEK